MELAKQAVVQWAAGQGGRITYPDGSVLRIHVRPRQDSQLWADRRGTFLLALGADGVYRTPVWERVGSSEIGEHVMGVAKSAGDVDAAVRAILADPLVKGGVC